MSERLPGSLQERLCELREEHGYSGRQKLADAVEIDRTRYGRSVMLITEQTYDLDSTTKFAT
ncbi:hypothetical protein SAMN04487831_11751 [Pseudobutyrivibrio sp. UC1225]|uniref:hypothetical protein n=1 Tax=Pseudobutyrivibrio sp. UC1225 TaxID=1798185 RepID=UPI0008ECA6DD|nr:hypothetical protein [Pseudobutyrivibrio sp. UC1225]SFO30073.1 hypothetical protein SAMN04487831_11751 [Pseudobutyrivibrio sp. UC1225]